MSFPPAIVTLSFALMGVAVGCEGTAKNTEPAPAGKAEPASAVPPEPSEAATTSADAPDLGAALTAATSHGIVAPPAGGSTFAVDPFVLAWVTAAVRDSGDRWLTRYAAKGADGVEVKGWQVRVPEDSVLAALGVHDGDVIEEVAGVKASDTPAVQAAVAAIDNLVRVTVYRVDVTLTLSYRIEPGLAWRQTAVALGGTPRLPPQVAVVLEAPPEAFDPAEGIDRPPPRAGGRAPSGSGKALPPSTSPKPSTPGTPSAPQAKSPVQCSSATVCTVERGYFKRMIGSPAKLQKQANVVPAIRNDVHSGYKLKSVKSGSAIHKLGFRSGDKVTHVNGYDLTNDLEALALYSGLSSTKRFKVRYIRGGSAKTKTILVK
ncbi:MAG: hypothetical protein AAF721_34045 [Myxococcota bacterium]